MKNTKTLNAIISVLEDKKDALESLKESVESERDKKQEAYDNKSEKWQDSEKGEEAYDAIEKLDEEIRRPDRKLPDIRKIRRCFKVCGDRQDAAGGQGRRARGRQRRGYM